MKIACVSDNHSHAPPPIQDVDFWLHAGDIYDGRNHKLHDSWLKIPEIYAVRGNHDYYDHKKFMKPEVEVTGIVREVRPGFFIVGIGWCSNRFFELPLNDNIAKCCHEVLRQCLFKMKDRDQSIILSHYAPLTDKIVGGSKEGWMYNSIQKVVEAIKPIAVVYGHIHDLFGQTYVKDGTLYICAGPKGGVLDTQSSTFSITPTQ